MTRAMLLPISAIVLLASATAVLASAILLPMSGDVAHVTSAGQTVATRFYAAVNAAIATGDTGPLREVVVPAFVDEEPLPGLPGGRDGLENYLLFLHATTPTARLSGTVLLAAADQVVAHVAMQDVPSSAPSGAVAARPAVWGAVDILHIVDGQVAGRWSSTEHLSLREPLAGISLILPRPIPRLLTLSRVSLAPGARWDSFTDGPCLLMPETGVLDVSVATAANTSTGYDPIAALPPARLAAGNPRVVPASSRFGMTNVGHAPAQALVLRFAVPSLPNGKVLTPSPLPSGVERHILAGDLATRLPSDRLTVTVERLALGHAAQLTVSSARGPALIGVDTGQLAATSSGTLWARSGQQGVNTATDASFLAPGDGLLLPPEQLVVLQPSGPAMVEAIVVTIQADPSPDQS